MKGWPTILLMLHFAATAVSAAGEDPFQTARLHRQKGRYAEAEAELKQLTEQKADPRASPSS